MREQHKVIGIVGLGHAVPDTIRKNDDPLFLRNEPPFAQDLFVGFHERRVLAPGERLEDLGVLAAQRALADAGVTADGIDRLYGTVSPGEMLLPSGLFAVHEALGLPREAKVVPIQSEFTNFVDALVCACDAVAAGRSERALVVVAAGWSRLVDYADAGAAGIGDAAGAVVVSRDASWELVDEASETHGAWRGAMTLQMRAARRSPPGVGDGERPLFVFEAEAARAFRELGLSVPERLFRRLVERHGIAPADVALVGHQPSVALLDAWRGLLGVGDLPSVLQQFGNCTLATSAVTLSLHARTLGPRHIVLLGMGLGQNFSAALLRRRETSAR